LIVNAGSGGAREAPDATLLRTLCHRHGLDAEVHLVPAGGNVDDAIEQALATGAGTLVAAGGDGTVNAVAARALEHDRVLGVLPLGTLNHFARDLDIPLELEAAVAALASAVERRVDVGLVNDRIFLNNASIGLYATIVVDRERQQRRLGRGKWHALLRATLVALREPDALELALEVDGRELRRRTPVLFVGNNDYEVQGPAAGQRARLDDGRLSLYVLHACTAWGLVWLALRTLVRGTARARDLDTFAATRLDVQARAPRLPVARDGEVDELTTPVRFSVRPGALRVLAPAPEAAP
jgi:diacylglycerol kinase family enzyme